MQSLQDIETSSAGTKQTGNGNGFSEAMMSRTKDDNTLTQLGNKPVLKVIHLWPVN
jgi:hypothetical protein